MMTGSRIDGVRLKIERAKKHIVELDQRIAQFSDDEPYEIGAKLHPVAHIHHTTLFIQSIKPVPQDFSVIIGDVVHNLRSALDHLAWQLVEVGGGSPNERTYFPICYGPQGSQQYRSAVGQGEIKKMRIGADTILRAVQPYNSGDDTLWHIHELDRIDKHRVLITTGTFFGEWSVDIGGGVIIPFTKWTKVPLVTGNEIVNIPTDTYNRQPHENFKLGIEIAFGEPEIVKGEPVLPTLQQMAEFVDRIVGLFEPFLI